jgi:hyperosmotically inducible protein
MIEEYTLEDKMKNMSKLAIRILPLILAGVLGSASGGQAGAAQDAPKLTDKKTSMTPAEEKLSEDVRRHLVMLPWYGVFDNFEYSVQGNAVVLSGQVTRPTLKSDAEAVVKKIQGVTSVVNNIEVLPLSPADDKIRMDVYRAIFSATGLDQYAMRAVPPIHIVVKNGHVTLSGVVSRSGDRDHAAIVAKGVSGVFSVTNNLRVEER